MGLTGHYILKYSAMPAISHIIVVDRSIISCLAVFIASSSVILADPMLPILCVKALVFIRHSLDCRRELVFHAIVLIAGNLLSRIRIERSSGSDLVKIPFYFRSNAVAFQWFMVRCQMWATVTNAGRTEAFERHRKHTCHQILPAPHAPHSAPGGCTW
jgi:hypothetical protein